MMRNISIAARVLKETRGAPAMRQWVEHTRMKLAELRENTLS
jgi:hypothetical protein